MSRRLPANKEEELHMNVNKCFALLMLAPPFCGFSHIAYAEKSDRDKKFLFEADRQEILPNNDDAENLLLEGNVILCQGTILIKSQKLVLKKDKSGAHFGEGFGSPVFFTQKQEGRADYLEATGERLEFDERTNAVKLFTNAKLTLGKDKLSADYISYNTATERYEAAGTAPGTKIASGGGRVHGVLYPKQKELTLPEILPSASTAHSTCPIVDEVKLSPVKR